MPKERENAPRHVPENLIYNFETDCLSGKTVNRIIEKIMVILAEQKITVSTAKQILQDTIKAVEEEAIIGDRNVCGEIIRAGR